jgi:hypothetical protein
MSIDITKLREGDILTLDCLSDDSTDSVYQGDAEFICMLDDGEVMVRIPGYSHPHSLPATTIVSVKYTRPVVDITNLKRGDVVVIKWDGDPESDYVGYEGKAVFCKELTLGDALFDVEGSDYPCIFPLNSITEILPKTPEASVTDSSHKPNIKVAEGFRPGGCELLSGGVIKLDLLTNKWVKVGDVTPLQESGYTSEYLLANQDEVKLTWSERRYAKDSSSLDFEIGIQTQATVADCIKLQRKILSDWVSTDYSDEDCLTRFINTHRACVIATK